MFEFFALVRDFYVDIFDLFNNTVFMIDNNPVSLGAMIFVPLVIGMVVSIFWKGAKS